MKKIWQFKRIFSVSMATILALALSVGSVSAATAPTENAIEQNASATIETANNLFYNGNFETGDKSSWLNETKDTATFTVTNEDKYDGNYSLKVVKNADGTGANITNYCYYAEENTVYSVSYSVKITQGNIQALPIIGQYTSNWQAVGGGARWLGEYAKYSLTDGWVQVSFDFTTDEGAQILEFGLAVNEGAGTCYFDDVAVFKKAKGGENIFCNGSFDGNSSNAWSIGLSETIPPKTVTETHDVMFNGGMEQGGNGWNFGSPDKPAAVVSTECVHSGNNAIKYDTATAGQNYFQNYGTNVEAGKAYTLSYYLKTTGDIAVNPYVDCSASEWGWEQTRNASDWTLVTNTFTANATGALYVGFQVKDGSGVAYIDDITVTYTTTRVATYTVTTDDMVNGTLEENTNAWALNSDVWTTDEAHNGTHSLKLVGESWNYGAKLTPGTEYTYTAYIKVTGAENGFTVYPYISNFGDTWLNAELMRVSENCDWKKVSYTFTAPNPDPVNGIRLGFVQSGTGNAYIDDITLTYDTEKEYTATYTQGVGTFGGNNSMMKVDTANEFWNYGTTVEEGKTYIYSMDIKIEGSQSGFQFYPYINNFINDWKIGNVYYNDTDWIHYEFEFTADAPHPQDGTRFGFIRNGTGTVYIDNVSLKEVVASVDTDIEETVITNGNFANGTDGWELNGGYGSDTLAAGEGLTGKGIVVSHTAASGALAYKVRTADYIAVEPGAVYIAKVYVKTTGNVTIGASLRANTANGSDYEVMPTQYSGYKMSGINGWQLITYRLTVPTDITWKDGASGVKLQLDMIFEESDATVLYDDVQMYREYAYGDVNGDGVVDLRDLVRYKKAIAQTAELVSKTYADVDNDRNVGISDLVELRKFLLDSSKTLGPTYFK